ncbi:MAG TPA: c-type cytochrome [Burkholderiales bacterium]
MAVLLAALPALSAAHAGTEAEIAPPLSHDARIAAAWQTLRVVDCARCHGKDHDGLAAPSIIAYARNQSREMFVRAVLDGDPARGMPAYRGNLRVLEGIDGIYAYFAALAQGNAGRGPGAPAR